AILGADPGGQRSPERRARVCLSQGPTVSGVHRRAAPARGARAEHGKVFAGLSALTGPTRASQVNSPADCLTMRWAFPWFSCIDVLHIRPGPSPDMALVPRPPPLHEQALTLLGPIYPQFY